MHYDKQNYRLPTESRTPLLTVTHGCSYNKCRYCSLYYKTPFGLEDMDIIEEDVKKIASHGPVKRLYFMNGDPFALSPNKLLELIDLCKKHIEGLESFSMFASVHNVQAKTDQELELLRRAGITDLYMGCESFHNPSLDLAGVGYRAEDSFRALKRLEKAGIGYSTMMILGLKGAVDKETAREIGLANASYMSQLKPINITITSLFIPNNSAYGAMRRKGDFIPASEEDKALELYYLFDNLKGEGKSFFYSFHEPSSSDMKKFYQLTGDKEAFEALFSYYQIKGRLPADRKKAASICRRTLAAFEKYPVLKTYPWEFLNKDKKRLSPIYLKDLEG